MYQLTCFDFRKMGDQEYQQLHGDSSEYVRGGLEGKTAWYSVGFIFGFKLRQILCAVDESEIEVYISHLRNVSAAREYDGDRLVEVTARLCEGYVRKESRAVSRRLVKLRQERFGIASHDLMSTRIRSRIRNDIRLAQDYASY